VLRPLRVRDGDIACATRANQAWLQPWEATRRGAGARWLRADGCAGCVPRPGPPHAAFALEYDGSFVGQLTIAG